MSGKCYDNGYVFVSLSPFTRLASKPFADVWVVRVVMRTKDL